jgi:NAD(P)-dependent dehydrogenase (short-subunit alcohol dehydrogenase family)
MSKVWFVTGSSRGLGRALVEALLTQGDRVVATARPSEVALLGALVASHGDQVCVLPLDVTDEPAAHVAVDNAKRIFGRIDVVVNNAGYGNVGPIEDTSIEDIRAQIETNLFGTINVTKAALPVLRLQGSGHFIQFSSIAGRVGPIGRGAYAASKWGVEGFSETLSKEVGPLGIKVTVVEPGGFRTDFAGASTTMVAGRPDYAATVGAVVAFQTDFNGKQPGNPAAAARVLIEIVSMEKPPFRLPLGSDAYAYAEQADNARLEELRKWRDLTISTDFPQQN